MLRLGKRKRDDHTLSYANALAKRVSKSIESTVRRRGIFNNIVRGIRGTHSGGASAAEGDVWGARWGEGLQRGAREGLDGVPGGRYDGLWHEDRGVAKSCTEGHETISTGSRRHRELSVEIRRRRHSCGNGTTRTSVELQSDKQRLRRRHPPSTLICGGGGVRGRDGGWGGGGLRLLEFSTQCH